MSRRIAVTRAALLGVLFAGALAACGDAPKSAPPRDAAAKPAAITYDRELGTLTAAIDDGTLAIGRQPGDALVALETVSLLVERARLTGDYDDFRKAEALLDATTARMDAGSYPCLAHARLEFALHRIAAASAALDGCPGSVARDEIAGLHADIAFYTGRYRQAELIYRALVNQVGTPQQYVRLAVLRNTTGSPGEAAALLEAAERRYHGVSATMKAWFKLQRGLIALDRGRFDEALAMYLAASDALPGWWLVDEHIAEVKQLGGDTAGAKTIYAAVIERTGAPEFMDALAQILAGEARHDEARALRVRARSIYEARLREFPEAAAGHALDHFLQDGANASRALALAQRNYETRPYGDAAVALGRAWIQNAQPKRAVDLLESHLADGWDTAEIHWVLGEALARLGQHDAASAAQRTALARNPASAAMYATAGK
jgi:tetratricopeptide (TPR) repeat protein